MPYCRRWPIADLKESHDLEGSRVPGGLKVPYCRRFLQGGALPGARGVRVGSRVGFFGRVR